MNPAAILERVLADTEWDGWTGRARLEERLRRAFAPPPIDGTRFEPVVTKFAGHIHLGRTSDAPPGEPRRTICRGTPAWTFEAWGDFANHPMHIRELQAHNLPACPDCTMTARAES